MATNDFSERPERREELAGWYAEVLADQQVSGLSVSEYAEALGVTPATLYQWRRRLSRRNGPIDQAMTPIARSGLIEVSLEKRPSVSEASALLLRLPRERCVEVPSNFDDAALRRLLRVLEQC